MPRAAISEFFEAGGCMKRILVIILLFFINAPLLLISEELPLVYDKEDTGANVRKPAMPAFSERPGMPNRCVNSTMIPASSPSTNHGYIYKNCIFEGAEGVTDSVLSRILQTRFPASEVVLIDCTLTNAVSPAGWRLDSPSEAPNVHFWEYNSRDLQGNPIDDAMRFAVSKRLTKETDAETIANYSNPVWVLGGDWNPRLAPVFSKQQIVPVAQHPALFLVGDSLMNTGSGTGEAGPWGYGAELIPMFDPAKIHVYNEGKGGRSSRGYREEGLWQSLLSRMEPGDWVLMQFGHNDAANSQNYPDRISGKGNGDELSEVKAPGGMKQVHSYGWYLRQYVQDAAEKGVKVVILSPVPRNQWADGKIRRGFDGYVQWAAEAAKASGAFYVDLNALAADRYDVLGQQAADQMFNDLQHTRKSGARINAESVVAGLKQLKNCPLAASLIKEPTPDSSEKKQQLYP
jgi:rhamnogalacturonan acetylesterase